MLPTTSPIIFLNPTVVLEAPPQQVAFSREASDAIGYQPGSTLGNAPVVALADLCDRIKARIVLTAATSPYDASDQLLARGLGAGRFATPPRTDPAISDRASAIRRWRDAHEPVRAVIIDRRLLEVTDALMVCVPSGTPLSAATVQQIANALR